MKRHALACFFIALFSGAYAQQDLQSLVDAEKAFAQTSVDKSTRTAFLENFDEKTIAFSAGRPGPGRKDWEKRPDNAKAYLFWWPVYADIAFSGDFGYTTGPAVFGPDKATKEVNGAIYYASVWKKDASGKWKVLADMGSSVYKTTEDLTEWATTSKPSKVNHKKDGVTRRDLLALDKSYNEEITSSGTSFDESFLSDEARIHRKGLAPIVGQEAIRNFSETQKFEFRHVDGEVASSGDMAYTYGTVKVTDTASEKAIAACYMRVWKIEEGEWTIVLDVLN